MQLLNKQLEKRFDQMKLKNSKSKNPIVIAKFFNPTGAGTWWATEITEYRMKDKKGIAWYTKSYRTKEARLKKGYIIYDVIFYGYVSIFGDHCDEWGIFSLKEFQDFKGFGGLGIERDLYCGEKKISEFNIKTL